MPAGSSTSLGRYCERFTSCLLNAVSDSTCALKLTVGALGVGAAVYVFLHWLVPHNPMNFSTAVAISEDARFHCYYRDDILDRFFARNSVNEWKQRIDEKVVALREEALCDRQRIFVPLQQFVKLSLS